jgi:DNA (cytosine-5)-methyltransferase 1
MGGSSPRRSPASTAPVLAVDLFCGAGGMSLGLQRAGLNVVCGVDNDGIAAQTYRRNLSKPVLECDIRALTAAHLAPHVPAGTRLVFAVCAPCQPFSKVRRAKRSRRDGNLLLAVGELIRELRPDGIIVENVPQISRRRKRILAAFCRMLDDAEYSYAYANLDAKDFGVPQTRRRMVLLAVQGTEKEVRLPTPGRWRVRTVRETIRGLPRIGAGGSSRKYPLHKAAHLSDKNLERIRATPCDGGDSRDWPESLRLPCHVRSEGFWDVYGRMSWDRPAPTLTTRCNSLSNGRFGHPSQQRAISLLEAALLQTFPKRFRFAGNQDQIAIQIGNAVPVRLAEVLGAALLRQL